MSLATIDALLRPHDAAVEKHPLAGMEAMAAAVPGMVPPYKLELKRWREAGSALPVPDALVHAFATSGLPDAGAITRQMQQQQPQQQQQQQQQQPQQQQQRRRRRRRRTFRPCAHRSWRRRGP